MKAFQPRMLERSCSMPSSFPSVAPRDAVAWLRRARRRRSLLRCFSRRSFVSGMVALMVGLGVVVGVFVEGWHPITALYVIAQITTTVGYGDVVVATDTMKLFMTFYVLLVLVVGAHFMHALASGVVDRNVRRVCASIRAAEHWLHGDGLPGSASLKRGGGAGEQTDALAGAGLQFLLAIIAGMVFHRLYEHCVCTQAAALEGCEDPDFETCESTGGITTTWASALYMSVITLTTVGFGDQVFHTRTGQAFGILWMFFGVVATATFLSELGDAFFQAASDEQQEETSARLGASMGEPSPGQPAGPERSGPKRSWGPVSRAAYRGVVVARLGLVPREVLAEIDREFELLAEGEDFVMPEKLPECFSRPVSGTSAAEKFELCFSRQASNSASERPATLDVRI